MRSNRSDGMLDCSTEFYLTERFSVLLVPEDVWQLWAPVDELVPVGQRGGERNKLNLVTAEAL